MIADYLLKFPDRTTAVQFGIANSFATLDENGEAQISLASHEHALCVIGEHWIQQPDIDGEPQPSFGDGQWWVLFRDLVGIPIPEGGDQFIVWSSASGDPRPTDEFTPNIFWA
jgi:hypothetical protein